MAHIYLTRGNKMESVHTASWVVSDAEGHISEQSTHDHGLLPKTIFPRSAIKLIQALPLVLSGAYQKFQLTEQELALACASHSGEEFHAKTAQSMLEKAGLNTDDLACGPQWPMDYKTALNLASNGGQKSALHNNCSGKHAGMLLSAKAYGYKTNGYEHTDHPLQQNIKALLEVLSNEKIDTTHTGTDGCSVPTWPVSLQGLATAFAKLGSGQNCPEDIAHAAQTLMKAVHAHPEYTAGHSRVDTRIMQALGERVFVKVGAEGVYCAYLADTKLGLALKCHDGAQRAAESLIAALLLKYIKNLSNAEHTLLSDIAQKPLKNWAGLEVGRTEPKL